MNDFLPFHFPSPPPPPPFSFSAFGITILSESFIYPLSSFIPLPIISASLPSMTHSPITPIHLPALFLHHRCFFCQPFYPSSVLLPSVSSLISLCHHWGATYPFLFWTRHGKSDHNRTLLWHFYSYTVPHRNCLPRLRFPAFVPLLFTILKMLNAAFLMSTTHYHIKIGTLL